MAKGGLNSPTDLNFWQFQIYSIERDILDYRGPITIYCQDPERQRVLDWNS